MPNKLIGVYGWFESAVAILVFAFLCYLNYLYFKGIYIGGIVTNKIEFMVIFIDFVGLVIVSLPWLTKKAGNISNEGIKEFLDLPDKNSKFKFSAISGFLSDQALASFLATVTIFTGKHVFESYGGVIAAMYVLLLVIVAVILGSVSLIRFLFHFTKYHGLYYGLVALLSTALMLAFFNVGLKMAA